jgi:hypothetical protein
MGKAPRSGGVEKPVSLADDILAAIPYHGCPLREIWSQFRPQPVQAIEGALRQLKITAAVRILDGTISRTNLPAMPPGECAPAEASIGLSRVERRLQLAVLVNRERERLSRECRAIRLDRSLDAPEQNVSIRQAEEASEQRVRVLQRRMAAPQATTEAS